MGIRVVGNLPVVALLLIGCLVGCTSHETVSVHAHNHQGVVTPDGGADVSLTDIGLGPEDTASKPDTHGAKDTNLAPDLPVTVAPPSYPHFDMVVDEARGQVNAWAYLIHVDMVDGSPMFHGFGYADTAERADYWPASTIKVYPAVAALVLLKEYGVSLDASATFYHQKNGEWVEDTTRTFRSLIFGSFNCSSNIDYTLLLRFAGIDWLNTEFFTANHGFDKTTLMSGYVNDRPHVYKRSEPQRIVVKEGETSFVREHSWSGVKYAHEVGCAVFYSSEAANCSSPKDMAEHFRRLMFDEYLDDSVRFDVRLEDLDWLRFGGPEPVMNNKDVCGGPGWEGVRRVFPEADFYHKGGRVSSYRLDLQYIEDAATGTRYIVAMATDTGSNGVVEKLSEEIARMVLNPNQYIHLANLKDHVNPVRASLTVYTTEEATLELITKDYELDPKDDSDWKGLAGTAVEVPVGTSKHELASVCLNESGKKHVKGRLVRSDGTVVATSDLHYVIVDANVACP